MKCLHNIMKRWSRDVKIFGDCCVALGVVVFFGNSIYDALRQHSCLYSSFVVKQTHYSLVNSGHVMENFNLSIAITFVYYYVCTIAFDFGLLLLFFCIHISEDTLN